MLFRRLLIALLVCTAWEASSQAPSKTETPSSQASHGAANVTAKSTKEGTNPEDFAEALRSGQLVLSNDQKQYTVVPPSRGNTGNQQTLSRWSFGGSALDNSESTPVNLQIGTKDEKPVYVPVLIPKVDAQTTSRNLEKLAQEGHLGENPQIQACVDGRECVKTCPDTKGGSYCCQWKCTAGK